MRVAFSAARLLARSLERSLVDVGSLCGRACRLRGRSLVRSNKASDKHSYLRLLYLLKRHSFPVERVYGSLCGRGGVRVACSAARSLARAVVGRWLLKTLFKIIIVIKLTFVEKIVVASDRLI